MSCKRLSYFVFTSVLIVLKLEKSKGYPQEDLDKRKQVQGAQNEGLSATKLRETNSILW